MPGAYYPLPRQAPLEIMVAGEGMRFDKTQDIALPRSGSEQKPCFREAAPWRPSEPVSSESGELRVEGDAIKAENLKGIIALAFPALNCN